MESQGAVAFLGLVVWFNWSRVAGEAVIVETTLGKVEGFRRRNDYGLDMITTTVDTFFGIPFAEPPVGRLRFENPLPVKPWPGILRATKRSAICWQYQTSFYSVVNLSYTLDMGDDCLYLNIFTPLEESSPSTTYPVMVYIHGGSNMVGSGNYFDGHVLAQFGVVVVTINFRLGPIGFLTTGDDRFPGNRAFYDQLMALNWIQTHIHRFRGRPDRVTLFGNSAGGWNVGFHMLSPLSTGLFHAAVVQSGSMLMNWAMKTKKEMRRFFDQLAMDVNCRNPVVEERVKCLKATDPLELCEMGMAYFANYPDGVTLPAHVIDLLKEGRVVNKVPVMIGVTAYEWLRFSSRKRLPQNWSGSMRENIDVAKFMISLFSFKFSPRIMEVINFVYKDWTDAYNRTKNALYAFQAAGDMHMTAPSVRLARELHKLDIPVRFYLFDHPVEMNIPDPDMNEMRWIGNYSYHESELPSLFGVPFTQENIISVWHFGNYSDVDRKVSRKMMTMWTNFAKISDPTPHTSRERAVPVPYDWKLFKPDTTDYFLISRHKLVTKQHLRVREVALWNRLVPQMLAAENITDLHLLDINWLERDGNNHYLTISWILAGVNVLFFAVGVVLVIVICRIRRTKKSNCTEKHTKEESHSLQNTNSHV